MFIVQNVRLWTELGFLIYQVVPRNPHLSFFPTGYIKGGAVIPRRSPPLTKSAACLEVSWIHWIITSLVISTCLNCQQVFFVTRPCSLKQVTVCNQMQTSSMQDNDKFPSRSIVNYCTGVISITKFQQLILVQMFKNMAFLIGYCIFFKSSWRRFNCC